jgi:hypothetical protein
MHQLFEPLYFGIGLKPTGLILGAVLVAVHLFALLRPAATTAWLRAFPRNKRAGIVILAIDLAWTWVLVRYMDMGEFFSLRKVLLIGLPVAFFLVIQYADEFLAVRATGAFFLLLATPVLGAAFLKEPWVPKLLLPLLAYAWVTAGMFWVGMPYTMRDQIGWLTARASRFRGACVAGIAYGVAVLACAAVFF